jgi:hypothetical protein
LYGTGNIEAKMLYTQKSAHTIQMAASRTHQVTEDIEEHHPAVYQTPKKRFHHGRLMPNAALANPSKTLS